jgi:MATH domain
VVIATDQWQREGDLQLQSEAKYSSPVFAVGGYPWRLTFYPRGDATGSYMSLYLLPDFDMQPDGWNLEAIVKLTLVNQLDKRKSHTLGVVCSPKCCGLVVNHARLCLKKHLKYT